MGRGKGKLFPNGRNASSVAFLMLERYVFDCPAYRTMKPGPRSLLDELIRRHNGSNNGHIGFGVRAAAKALCVGKDTASRYFEVLKDRGFIAPSTSGGFNMKDPESRRATEWRLTWKATDCMAATKDFMAFGKKSTVTKNRTIGPENEDTADEVGRHCPEKQDLLGSSAGVLGPQIQDTYKSSHRRGLAPDPVASTPLGATR